MENISSFSIDDLSSLQFSCYDASHAINDDAIPDITLPVVGGSADLALSNITANSIDANPRESHAVCNSALPTASKSGSAGSLDGLQYCYRERGMQSQCAEQYVSTAPFLVNTASLSTSVSEIPFSVVLDNDAVICASLVTPLGQTSTVADCEECSLDSSISCAPSGMVADELTLVPPTSSHDVRLTHASLHYKSTTANCHLTSSDVTTMESEHCRRLPLDPVSTEARIQLAPFRCKKCSSVFRRLSSLRAHLRRCIIPDMDCSPAHPTDTPRVGPVSLLPFTNSSAVAPSSELSASHQRVSYPSTTVVEFILSDPVSCKKLSHSGSSVSEADKSSKKAIWKRRSLGSVAVSGENLTHKPSVRTRKDASSRSADNEPFSVSSSGTTPTTSVERSTNVCELCGRSFFSGAVLRRHMLIHSGARPHRCRYCPVAFNQRSSRSAHEVSVHTCRRRFLCFVCGVRFALRNNLVTHMRRIHSAIPDKRRAFKCDLCACRFMRSAALSAHRRYRHFDRSPSDWWTVEKLVDLLRRLMIRWRGDRPRLTSVIRDVWLSRFVRPSLLRQALLQLTSVACVRHNETKDPDSFLISHCDLREPDSEKARQTEAATKMLADDDNHVADNSLNASLCAVTPEFLTENRTYNGRLNADGDDEGTGVVSSRYDCPRIAVISDIHSGRKHLVRVLYGTVTGTTGNRRRIYECLFCERKQSKTTDMVRHMRLHYNDRPFMCDHCPRRFRLQHALVKHSRCAHFKPDGNAGVSATVPENRITCMYCVREFRGEAQRDAHVLRCHSAATTTTNTAKIISSSTGRAFFNSQTDSTTGDVDASTIATESPGVADTNTTRPFACTRCPAAFKQRAHLKTHERLHSGERPYVCSLCNRRFTTSSTLRTHLVTHEPDDGSRMPSRCQCPLCPMKLTTLSSLRRHLTTHSNMRPFTCSMCDGRFKTGAACRRHERSVHYTITNHTSTATTSCAPVQSRAVHHTVDSPLVSDTATEACGDIHNRESPVTVVLTAGNSVRIATTANASSSIATLSDQVTPCADTSAALSDAIREAPSLAVGNRSSTPVDLTHSLLASSSFATTSQSVPVETGGVCSRIPATTDISRLPVVFEDSNDILASQTSPPGIEDVDACESEGGVMTELRNDFTQRLINELKSPAALLRDASLGSFSSPQDSSPSFPDNVLNCAATGVDGPSPVENYHTCNVCGYQLASLAVLRRHIAARHTLDGRGGRAVIELTHRQTAELARRPLLPDSSVGEVCLVRSAIESLGGSSGGDVTASNAPESRQGDPRVDAEIGSSGTASSNVSRHKCGTCGKHFQKASDLTRHLRIHTGERPFVCKICDRRFTLLSALNSHHRTHTGERNFSCIVCAAAFTSKCSLLAHTRIHTGAKPYTCDDCGATFRTTGQLRVHERGVHKRFKRLPSVATAANDGCEPAHVTVHIQVQSETAIAPSAVAASASILSRSSEFQSGAVSQESDQMCRTDATNYNGNFVEVSVGSSRVDDSSAATNVIVDQIGSCLPVLNDMHITPQAVSHLELPSAVEMSTDTPVSREGLAPVDAILSNPRTVSGHISVPSIAGSHLSSSYSLDVAGRSVSDLSVCYKKNDVGVARGDERDCDTRREEFVLPPVAYHGALVTECNDRSQIHIEKECTANTIQTSVEVAASLQTNLVTGAAAKKVLDCNRDSVQWKRVPSCEQCGCQFRLRRELREHLNTAHPAVRRKYACSQCSQSFDKRSLLIRHMRHHTGERPFPCLLCARAFTQSNALAAHMRTHRRERPYPCPFCGDAFSQRGNMRTHVRRVHAASSSTALSAV